MKELKRPWLRTLLFVLGGMLAGLAYYRFVGCSSGSCAISANPVTSMLYMGLIGFFLSGGLCGAGRCSGGSCQSSRDKDEPA